MIKSENQVDVNFLVCGKCFKEIVKIGKNLRVAIPSIHYHCLNCDSHGMIDKIYADTTDNHKKFFDITELKKKLDKT